MCFLCWWSWGLCVLCFFCFFSPLRYHLQALRHLCVLAAEPRLLVPVDVDTLKPCYALLDVTYKVPHMYMSLYFSCEVLSGLRLLPVNMATHQTASFLFKGFLNELTAPEVWKHTVNYNYWHAPPPSLRLITHSGEDEQPRDMYWVRNSITLCVLSGNSVVWGDISGINGSHYAPWTSSSKTGNSLKEYINIKNKCLTIHLKKPV